MTQDERVIEYIEQHGSITSLEAIRELGNTRLAATMHRLKREHCITTETVEVPNRDGKACHVARYSLAQPPLPPVFAPVVKVDVGEQREMAI